MFEKGEYFYVNGIENEMKEMQRKQTLGEMAGIEKKEKKELFKEGKGLGVEKKLERRALGF